MPSNIYQPRPSTLHLNARSGDIGMEDAVYVNTNETLVVSCVSSIGGAFNPPTGGIGVQLGIQIRMLSTTSQLQYHSFIMTPTNDYSLNEFSIKLPEGFILNLSVYTIGTYLEYPNAFPQTPLIGETWVSVATASTQQTEIYTGTFLCQGYVTNNQRVVYPVQQPLSYDGTVFMVMPGTYQNRPGQFPPGIALSYQIPPNAVDELLALQFTFATSASVGQRVINLSVQQALGIATPTILLYQLQQDPSTTSVHSFVNGGIIPPSPTAPPTVFFHSWPDNLILPAGSFLQTGGSILSGDQFTNVSLLVKEWLVP